MAQESCAIILTQFIAVCVIALSLSLSEIVKHTHRPQGVNYHKYLHVLKYLLLLYLNRKT